MLTPPSSSEEEELGNTLLDSFDRLLLRKQHHHNSLELIKKLLIGASLGGTDSRAGIQFIKLQDRIELNASLVLLRFISQISELPQISDPIQQPNIDHQSDDIITQLSSSFILLQGLLHLHPPSQNLFASEYNLRILLKFLPLALHSSTFSSIGVPLLDLILITFVDSPTNAQLFESAGGLEILVQAMKQKTLKTELRVKVLETLWAWWIDDDDPVPENHPILPPITHPHQPSPNLHSALSLPPPNQGSSPSVRKSNCQAPCPKSSVTKLYHELTKTPSNHQTRGNSRIRPISLPPPSLPEEDEKTTNTSANLSDGHETPKPTKPTARVRIQPSVAIKSISRSQSSLTQEPHLSSPLVQSSSEGSSATPSRPSKPTDPASRLRLMLENTAGEFVPATPHHPHRTRPMTAYNHRNSSPTRTPHALHKSHPVSLLKKKPAQSDSDDSRSNPARPSDESEDSDRLDVSPHRLFAVRQRRTAIKQGSNTPQRMIRHKQSASLGSIQHQLQHTPNTNLRSRQSSEDERAPRPDPGGSLEGEGDRSRDPTRRLIRSSTLLTSGPITPQSHPKSATPDTQRRSSSRLAPAESQSVLEPLPESKRLSVDTPRASRAINTPIRVSGPSKALGPSSPTIKSGSSSSQDEEHDYHTPKRDSEGPTPIKSVRETKTLITPATPLSSTSNRMIATGLLNPLSSPNKKFISKPLTPNHSLINQSDLELIVNGTDSDVGPSVALLSAKKERSAKRRSLIKKAISKEPPSALGHPKLTPTAPVVERVVSEEPVLVNVAVDELRQSMNGDSGRGIKLKKTGILEKYMANSDELVRSFREIGVGFKALSRHHHQSSLPATRDLQLADSAKPPEKPLHRSNR